MSELLEVSRIESGDLGVRIEPPICIPSQVLREFVETPEDPANPETLEDFYADGTLRARNPQAGLENLFSLYILAQGLMSLDPENRGEHEAHVYMVGAADQTVPNPEQ